MPGAQNYKIDHGPSEDLELTALASTQFEQSFLSASRDFGIGTDKEGIWW